MRRLKDKANGVCPYIAGTLPAIFWIHGFMNPAEELAPGGFGFHWVKEGQAARGKLNA
jgi:hypothetical protein